jgi:glucosyl-dolichyl phosphate glucuronosyltransferase
MKEQISITIAICTYNRAGYLQETLENLSRQTAEASQFEILVIDNNCIDQTADICIEFADSHPDINFRAIREKEQGLSFARNRAVVESWSDVLLFIDDDVYLKPDFVNVALRHLEENPDQKCAGGRIFVHFDDGEPDWIPAELMPMFGLHDLGPENKLYPATNFPRGGNMLIHKEVFEAIGLFDTQLGRIGKKLLGSEEKAFFDRARRAGFELFYWGDLSLFHRIGLNRLEKEYLEHQSIGIGESERLRLEHSRLRLLAKFGSEMIKFAGSFLLGTGYLIRGKFNAARFMIQFRVWVLKGLLKNPVDMPTKPADMKK